MIRIAYLIAFGICLLLCGCSPGPSLEKYFVKKSENKDFIQIDLSPSMLKLDPKSLTVEQAKAIESLDKLNVLVFKGNEGNKAVYQAEKDTLTQILKKNKYQELMKFNRQGQGASVSFVGTDDDIEEFILFGYSPDSGFGVVRVLGDHMTPNGIVAILSVLKDSKVGMEQLKPLQNLVK